MGKPSYDIHDFVMACQHKNVFFIGQVLDDAANDFGLTTEEDLLEFLSGFLNTKHEFVNSIPWRNNPDSSMKIKVDAYEFWADCKHGYLAFMYVGKIRKWQVKSFHISDMSQPDFVMALKKYKKRLEEESEHER